MIKDGNTSNILLKELILGLSGAKFSGDLTLNEGEHFCVIRFYNGDISGAFGWKLEGDNAIIHLFLEKRAFDFSLSLPVDIKYNLHFEPPRGTLHILELMKTLNTDFSFLSGGMAKSITMNESIQTDIDLSGAEMKELLKFAAPCPVESIVSPLLKKNLFSLKKFFDRKFLTVIS